MNKVMSPRILAYILFSIALISSSYFFKLYLDNKTSEYRPAEADNKNVILEKKPGLISLAEKKLANKDLNSVAQKEDSSSVNNEYSITEETGKDLLLAYIAAKESGKSTEDIEPLVEKEMKKLMDVEYRKYEREDLSITKNFKLEDYKKQMRRALTPLTKIKEYELDTVAKIIDQNDEKSMEILREDEALYTETISRLLQVPVNEDLLVPHLSLINAYSKFLASLQLIERSKNDIILVYPALKIFLEADAEIYSAFDALKIYVELNEKNK